MKQTTFNVYRQRMAEVLLVIQRHLDEALDLEELARVAHFSPYHFHRIYARLFGQWLPHSGRELRSEPSLEFYLNDPDGTPPEELLTEIYAPLEPRPFE